MEAVGIANGDGELADADLVGVAQARGAQLGSVNVDHRQVGIGIVADQMRIRAASVSQRDFNPGGAVDDVAVGQDEAVRREDEPGAAALTLAIGAAHLNVHHRRAYLVGGLDDGLGISI